MTTLADETEQQCPKHGIFIVRREDKDKTCPKCREEKSKG